MTENDLVVTSQLIDFQRSDPFDPKSASDLKPTPQNAEPQPETWTARDRQRD
jgi:hypothetical protein